MAKATTTSIMRLVSHASNPFSAGDPQRLASCGFCKCEPVYLQSSLPLSISWFHIVNNNNNKNNRKEYDDDVYLNKQTFAKHTRNLRQRHNGNLVQYFKFTIKANTRFLTHTHTQTEQNTYSHMLAVSYTQMSKVQGLNSVAMDNMN